MEGISIRSMAIKAIHRLGGDQIDSLIKLNAFFQDIDPHKEDQPKFPGKTFNLLNQQRKPTVAGFNLTFCIMLQVFKSVQVRG